MARKETTTCDECQAEIPPEHVHLRLDCAGAASYRMDVRSIDREMLKLFTAPKDFCNLLCVQRWIESLGAMPEVKS